MKHDYIKYFLSSYNITKYKILDDDIIDVYESVNLSSTNISVIPVKFNIIEGNFFISYNNLHSLENSPTTVYGDFGCRNNNLESLKGGPVTVDGFYNCMYNKLKTLDYVADDIDPNLFYYGYNDLSQKEIDRYWEKRLKENPIIFLDIMDKVSNELYDKYLYILASKDQNLI